MPTFEVDVGSSTYQVDAPDSNTAWAWANQYHTQNQPQPQPKESGFFPALKHGIESSFGTLSTGVQSLFGNANEAAAAGAQREAQSNFAPKASLENLVSAFKQGPWTGIKEAASQAPEIVGGAAPSIGEYMGAAELGAISPIPGGAILAPAALFALQHLGGLAEQQAAAQQQQGQSVSVNPKQLAPYALGQTAIDIALGGGAATQLGKSVVSKMFGETVANLIAAGDKKAAEKLAQETVKQTLMKGTVVGAAMGVPAGVGQVALERAASDKPLLSDDALKEYAESAYQYGALSPLGGLARLHGVAEAKDTLNKLNRPAPGAPGTQPGALPGESPKDTALRIKAARDAQEQLAADAKALKAQQAAEAKAAGALQFPPIEGVEAKAEATAPTQPAGSPVLDTELLNNIGVNKDHPAFDLLKDTDLSTAKGQEKLTDILTANAQMPEASRVLDQSAADALQTKLNTFSAPTKFPEIKAPETTEGAANVPTPNEPANVIRPSGATEVAGTQPEGVRAGVEVAGEPRAGQAPAEPITPTVGLPEQNAPTRNVAEAGTESPLKPEVNPNAATPEMAGDALGQEVDIKGEKGKITGGYSDGGFEIQRGNARTGTVPGTALHEDIANQLKQKGIKTPEPTPAPTPQPTVPELPPEAKQLIEGNYEGEAPKAPEIPLEERETVNIGGKEWKLNVGIQGKKYNIIDYHPDDGFIVRSGKDIRAVSFGSTVGKNLRDQLREKGILPSVAATEEGRAASMKTMLGTPHIETNAPKTKAQKPVTDLDIESIGHQPTKENVTDLSDHIEALQDKIKELRGAQKDIAKGKGIPAEDVRNEHARLEQEIGNTKALLKAAQQVHKKTIGELEKVAKGKEVGKTELSPEELKRQQELNKALGNDPAWDEEQRANQAVGALNRPGSPEARRKNAAEYLYLSEKGVPETVPRKVGGKEVQVKNSAYEPILKALRFAFGSYPEDFKPSIRKELTERFGDPAVLKKEVLRDPAFKDLEFNQGRTADGVDINSPVNKGVREALARGDVKGALLNIGIHGTDVQSKIARRLIDIFGRHGTPEVTVQDAFSVRNPKSPDRLAGGLYDIANDRVIISSAFQHAHNVLHELVHAASSKLLRLAEEGKLTGDAAVGYKQLKDLYNYVRSGRVEKGTYALTNIREFLAEALSNEGFQKKLDGIQYQRPGQSALSRLWEGLKNLLGLKVDKTALDHVLRISDEMLEQGRQEQTRAGTRAEGQEPLLHTPQMAAEAEASGLMGEKQKQGELSKFLSGFKGEHAIQNLLVNKLASITAKFNDFYAGKVRDLAGNINPAVLLSKAQDWTRTAMQVKYRGIVDFLRGEAVVKDFTVPKANDVNNPDHYIAKMYPDIAGEPVSFARAVGMVGEEANRTKTPFKEVMKTVGDILLKNRFYELRERNNRLDAQIKFLTDRGVSPNHKSVVRLHEMKKDAYNDGTLTDAELDAAHQHFVNNPDLQKISHILDAVRFKMLDTLVEARRLSKEQADIFKEAAGYIPFERLGEFGDTIRQMMKDPSYDRGVAASKALKKLEGSSRALSNPFESYAKFMDWAVKESMNNFAGIRAAEDLEMMGLAKKLKNVDSNDKGVVKLYDNGERVAYSIDDPLLYVAFHSLDKPVRGIMKAFQKTSQILRAGVSMVPAFGWRNAIDDITRNYAYANVENPGQMTLSTLAGFPGLWIKELKGVQDPIVQSMSARGVEATYGFQGGLDLKNILTHLGLEHESLPSKIFHWVESGAKAADLTSRRAIYAQTLAETKSAQFPQGDHLLAEHRAREIINFSNRGSSGMMSQLASIIPFFNAYAQGMGKLYNAATGKAGAMGTPGMSIARAQRMFYTRMATLTALGTAYALLMTKDDNYWNIDNYIRDNNWILPFGDKLGFTPAIPAASELAYFYKAIPERIVQYYMLKGTPDERSAIRMIGEMMSRGIDVFSSPNVAVPQLIKPFLENSINYSFYMGRPLESQQQQNLRPAERWGNSTSEISKRAADVLEKVYQTTGIDWLSVSPIKIDNALRGILGSVAGTAMALTDQLLNPDKTDRPMHQMLAAQLTGASAFMKDPVGSRMLNEFYNLQNEVNMANTSYKQLQQKDPTRAGEFYMANRGSIIYYDRVNATKQYIDQLNQQITQLTTSPMFYGLDPAGRRERITELKRMETELAKHVFVLRRDIDKANAWVD